MRRKHILVCILLIACVLFAGCSGMSANKKQLSIRLLDETVSGSYTGTMKNKLPSGEGTFQSSDQKWAYTGSFREGTAEVKNGELIGAFPLCVTVNGVEYSGTYSGEVQGNRITGSGKFSSSGDAFSYEGKWIAGSLSGAGNVTGLPHEITFQGRDIEGSYSGAVTDAVPDGNGTFVTEEGDFQYKGIWKKGEISGKGHLIDQNFVVHFSAGDRIGLFEGIVQNGGPEGSGSFSSVNSSGVGYTYEGEWSNGLFNGLGYCVFENGYLEDGHFTNGEYIPAMYDIAKYLGSGEHLIEFELSEPAKAFLQAHQELFPSENAGVLEAFLDPDTDYQSIMRAPESYGGKMIRFEKMEVLQTWDQPLYRYDHFTTLLLVSPAPQSNYVFAFYPGALPDVLEKDAITVYGIPMNASSYLTTEGGTNSCLAFFVAHVEK